MQRVRLKKLTDIDSAYTQAMASYKRFSEDLVEERRGHLEKFSAHHRENEFFGKEDDDLEVEESWDLSDSLSNIVSFDNEEGLGLGPI